MLNFAVQQKITQYCKSAMLFCCLAAKSCLTLCEPARLLCPWHSPGKNTGVGGHSLLQGILPTQGANPGLLHCRQILHHLSHQAIRDLLNISSLNFIYLWATP